MPVRIELSLRLPNSPGALADVCSVLAEQHVNVAALAVEPHGNLRMVVDNHVRGAGALRDARHRITERDVLVMQVSNTAGGLLPAARLVAGAGVNVEYAYAGALPTGESIVVFGVDDAPRAAAAAGV